MRAPLALALALALALTLGPQAAAHVEEFSQGVPLVIGPYNVFVTPKPEPMFSNSALSLTGLISRAADNTYVTTMPATLILTGPDGEARAERMSPDGSGYVVASIAVHAPGNYTARIGIEDEQGAYVNETTFIVYPDLAVRLRSADPGQSDPVPGKPFALSIETIDNITLVRADAFDDLAITLERWTDDHKTKLGEETKEMRDAGVGLWKLDHVFKDAGMYHLRFASRSGGFKADDVPILHVYARAPLGTAIEKDTPLPAAAPLVALGVAASLATLAHRTRGGGRV